MRCVLKLGIAISLVGCAGVLPTEDSDDSVETGMRWITMDNDSIETARELGAPTGELLVPYEVANDIAIVPFESEDFLSLSDLMHEQHHRCSGFMVHDTLEQARAAVRGPEAQVAVPEYTLDNAVTVNEVLPELTELGILTNIQTLSNFNNRYYQSDTGEQASQWLQALWQGYAAAASDVTVELVEHGWKQKSVVMTIPGSMFPNEIVVVGGHLDSIVRGRRIDRAPGADDDASGIATFSEVIRALMVKNYRPLRTVKFMAYAAEEVGLRGSQAIVQDFKTRGVNVVGVMQLDMTNYKGSTTDIWLMDDFTNPAQNAFIGTLIQTYVTDATWAYSRCGYACSDHASWHRAGYPASTPFESKMGEYNRNIHTENDTLEVSHNNAQHALKFAKVAAAYVVELAKGTSSAE